MTRIPPFFSAAASALTEESLVASSSRDVGYTPPQHCQFSSSSSVKPSASAARRADASSSLPAFSEYSRDSNCISSYINPPVRYFAAGMSRDSVALYRAAFRFVTLRDILPDFIPRQSDRAFSKAEAQSPFAAETASPDQTISSGWNTSSNLSAVRKPSSTHASFREMLSLYAFFAVLAAFS